MLRLTATLGFSALLTVSSAQSAVAPPSNLLGERTVPDLTIPDPVPSLPPAAHAEAPSATQVAMLVQPALEPPAETHAVPAPETEAQPVPEVAVAAPEIFAPAPAPPLHSRDGAVPQEHVRFNGVRVPRWIVETILRAAEVTGVDPSYMMALADKESSFLVDNRPSTSSAEGLFQFIERTWLEVVREFGPKHGLQEVAAVIQSVGGQLVVPDEAMREKVLALRRDPYLSALMAAEMMKRDRARIERRIGRTLDLSELYLMHFLGAENAGRLLKLVDGKPRQSAPRVFPQAAKANRALFFEQEKRKVRHLTVREVYERLDRMMEARLDRYEGVTALAPMRASLDGPLFADTLAVERP